MRIPVKCPFCSSEIKITGFKCMDCGASVNGSFDITGLPVTKEEWEFIRLFIRAGGNLKRMGEILNLSYPTLKAKLEKLRRSMGFPDTAKERDDVISELEMGYIDVNEALKRLEEKGGN